MQPYQGADEEMRRRGEQPINALKSAGSIALAAASVAAGSKIASKVIPFLSKYIPQDLVMKGLSKIDPRLGKFFKKALSEGHDEDEVKNFLKEKIDNQPTKDKRNLIEKHSPELHQFIDQLMKKGKSHFEAGAIARMDKRFEKAINALKKEHKTGWEDILESVYGNGAASQNQSQQPAQQAQDLQQQQMPQQPQQMPQAAQQPGSGQQKLMEILRQLKQARGQSES